MQNINQHKVAIIYGGPSKERAVSEVTSKMIFEALKNRYDSYLVEYGEDLASKLNAIGPDVVYPAMHGAPGEDGTLQGFLDVLGLPYVGSGQSASAFAMNKGVAKLLYRQNGMLTPRSWVGVADALWSDIDHSILEFVVKPIAEGSAIGVSFYTLDQLEVFLKGNKEDILVEECIRGREITAGILEKKGVCLNLPVVEITTPENSWYDYEHRYTVGLSDHIVPAKISRQLYAKVQNYALNAHKVLGCSDLSRSDFIVTDHDVYILETNTLPGMTPTSLFPDEAAHIDIDFESLICGLIENHL